MQRPGRPRVLIVDDQPQNIEVLAEALGAAYDLVAATTPGQAIERARAGVDLALLDVVMPGQDGFDLCRALKADPATRDIPVIFVTALGEVQDEARGFDVGGVDYITKPIVPATVRARVRTHLELRGAQRRLEREAETLAENLRLKDHVERLGRHDLKTPLGSIVSIPQILRDQGGLNADQVRLLDSVESAGYRILEMVNRSLDLFRMESGAYSFAPQKVDLRALVGRVVEDLDPLAKERRVSVAIVPEPGDLSAAAEDLLSYSMLANLVKNAIEATSPDQAVRVSVRRDREHVTVAIHNPAAVPSELRGSFFRKYASHGKRSGSGLGAYSARLMALTQAGALEMTTSEDDGTTLSVRLPAHDCERGVEGPAPTSEIRRNVTPRLVFLVVDDDEPTRFVLARILEGARAVHHASNGRDALARARELDPDVVLLDAEMPLVDGYGAAARIRAWEASTHARRRLIVGLSAHGDAATERAFLEAGCDLVLAKPVSRRALLEALDGAALRVETGSTGAPFARDGDEVEIDADLAPHMDRFMASRRAQAAELRDALASGDAPGARRLAHKLRGGLDMCGFAAASALARGIEEALATGDAPAAPAQAAALGDYLDRVRWRARDASHSSKEGA